MMRLMSLVIAILAASVPAYGQDSMWTETKFHRVHLRNGNFIDGKVVNNREMEVDLRMPSGDMTIKKETIDRIELIKIRSLNEKPRIEPPLKKAVLAQEPTRKSRAVSAPIVIPMIDPVIRLNLEGLFARFRSASPTQRTLLIKEMAAQEHAAPYLAAVLPGMDEDLGLAVKEALILMKDSEANPTLIAELDHERIFVRIQALEILAETAQPDNLPALRRCLQDELPAIRVATISTLTSLGDPEALEKFAELFLDENVQIRAAAISNSLRLSQKLGAKDVLQEALKRALTDARGPAASELSWAAGRTGNKDLWSSVAYHLKDQNASVRGAAVEALTALAAPASLETLIHQFRIEDDKNVQLRLTTALQALRSPESIPVLIEWLRNNDQDLVDAASRALYAMTKQRFGSSYDQWFDWWESVRPK